MHSLRRKFPVGGRVPAPFGRRPGTWAYGQAALQIVSVTINLKDCGAEAEREGEVEGQCRLCFAAGTPIHTSRGDVPVEQIEVGDEVLAQDRATGKLEYEPVSALTQPHRDKLLDIRVEGERDPLHPSTGHPFWVRRGEADSGHWINAANLKSGELLEAIDGSWRTIETVIPVERQETVYNFTVDKDHDYFVGETGFLVHNQNCGCNPVFHPHDLHPDTVTGENPNGLYPIKPTGSYSGDRQALLDAAGIDNPGPGWAAHHQSFDPGSGMMIMQLVDSIVHGYFTHTGGVKDCGVPYVP